MRRSRPRSIALFILVGLLAASLAVNLVLFSYTAQYSKEVNQVRLDPLDSGRDFTTPALLMSGQKRVVFFGDSRIEQWPMPPDNQTFQYINRGISGETTAQAAGRFQAQILPLKPDVLVLQIGVNDLKTIPMFPDQKDTIIANCIANIRQIIEWSKAIDASVILTPIFPVSEPTLERRLFSWSDDVATSIQTANGQLRALASDQVILFDTDLLLLGAGNRIRPEFAADTLHLNGQGYAVLNQKLAATLQKLSPSPKPS